MGTKHFSVRLDDDVIESLDEIADECRVKRANVIDWACEAYTQFAKENGGRMLTATDLEIIIDYIKTRAAGGVPRVHHLRVAESPPHEPGKIINPAAAGGAGRAPAKAYPKPTKRKSSG